MAVRNLLAVFACLASTAVADIPWEWDETRAVRTSVTKAAGLLPAFVSKGCIAEGTASACGTFDSRVRTVCDYAVVGFSTRPLGAVLVIR